MTLEDQTHAVRYLVNGWGGFVTYLQDVTASGFHMPDEQVEMIRKYAETMAWVVAEQDKKWKEFRAKVEGEEVERKKRRKKMEERGEV